MGTNRNHQIGAIRYGINSIGEQEQYVIGSSSMTTTTPPSAETNAHGVITSSTTVQEAPWAIAGSIINYEALTGTLSFTRILYYVRASIVFGKWGSAE